MTDILNKYEKEQIINLTKKKNIPSFRSGDTIRVNIKVVEGDRSRTQAFEGVCISKKNAGINSSFTVRKISHGEGVERIFPLFSPILDKIEVIRQGDVRRSKLYYLRKRSGKSARISDKDRGNEANQYTLSENTSTDNNIEEKQSNNESSNIETKNISEIEEKNNIEEKQKDEENISKSNEPKK